VEPPRAHKVAQRGGELAAVLHTEVLAGVLHDIKALQEALDPPVAVREQAQGLVEARIRNGTKLYYQSPPPVA